MNVSSLIGRLTSDPKVEMTPSGTKVCSFTLAVNRGYKKEDGTYIADFIPCVAWRKTATFLETYFKKGDYVGIHGSIQTRTYQDKDTGKNRTIVEVVVNNAYFCSDKSDKIKPVETAAEAMLSKPVVQEVSNVTLSDLDDFSEIASDDGDLPF